MANIKYFYVRNKKAPHDPHRGDPVACIASHLDGDNVHYALSIVKPRTKVRSTLGYELVTEGDEFSKQLARRIAHGRLERYMRNTEKVLSTEGDNAILLGTIVPAERTSVGVIKELLKAVSGNVTLPCRVRKAADTWLNENTIRNDPEYKTYLELKKKFESKL